MNARTKRAEDMTLAELEARATELGIEGSGVEPIAGTGNAPVKADWLREVLKAEKGASPLKDEWREAGGKLVDLFRKVDDSKDVRAQVSLATKLADGTACNSDLVHLRDGVKAAAAMLRQADKRDLATKFSDANHLVRRAERATRIRRLDVVESEA